VTDEPEEYLLAAEVGRLLRVSPKTISRWAKEGKLPYSRISAATVDSRLVRSAR
jgi:predicted site-specific integrase-resolvase